MAGFGEEFRWMKCVRLTEAQTRSNASHFSPPEESMTPGTTRRSQFQEGRPRVHRWWGLLSRGVAVLCLLLFTGCEEEAGPEVGVLDIVIVGLPDGLDADVEVTGPNDYTDQLTGSRVLAGLGAGGYGVSADPVGPYVAVAPSQDVDVLANQETEVDVIYQDVNLALNECAPYQPTAASGGEGGEWTSGSDENTHSFSAPSDPGGGYISVTLATGAPSVPWMNVTTGEAGAIASGGALNSSDEEKRINVFEAAPGQGYMAEVSQYLAPPFDAHPWEYVISWAFQSRVDCYEPNDVRTDAKYVVFGDELEAYAIAGHTRNGVTDNDPQTFDWYRFQLESDVEVTLELLATPANTEVGVRLFREGEPAQVGPAIRPDPGNLFEESLGVLGEGVWHLEFKPRVDARVIDPLRGEDTPEHFDTPYAFRLTATSD